MELKIAKLKIMQLYIIFMFVLLLPIEGISAERVIDIGKESLVKTLFSYPNIDHEDQTLTETVQVYLSDSMKRENLGNYQAKFYLSNGNGKIRFAGPKAETVTNISKRYKSYFSIGKTGIVEYKALRDSADYWHPKWQFLLPQGIAIENAKIVEIMDFPPITLIPKQDYLDSRTTNQWWRLLGKNGISDSEKPLYSSILDIVLVAAPASHGKKLRDAGIYDGHFPKYTDSMLKLLSNNTGTDAGRPLLALGYPIRVWIKDRWGVDIKVNEVALLEVSSGVKIPVIGGNHPAYYLRSRGSRGWDSPIVKAILRQDLITAAWAAEMGENPNSDPHQVLKNAKEKWKKSENEAYVSVLKDSGLLDKIGESQLQGILELEPTKEQLLALEIEFYDEIYSFEESESE